jgi:hypothetical protein
MATATATIIELGGSVGKTWLGVSPTQTRSDREQSGEEQPQVGVRGQPLCCAGWCGEETEQQQQRAKGLAGLRGDEPDDCEEAEAERSYRHALGGSDADSSEVRAEENTDAGGAVAGAGFGGEDREKERAEADCPVKERADDDIVEGAEDYPAENGGREGADADVEPEDCGSERAGPRTATNSPRATVSERSLQVVRAARRMAARSKLSAACSRAASAAVVLSIGVGLCSLGAVMFAAFNARLLSRVLRPAPRAGATASPGSWQKPE